MTVETGSHTHVSPAFAGRRDTLDDMKTISIAVALFASALLPAGAQAAPPPAWSVNQPIYEVNLQTFSHGRNYKELQNRIPKLKALGIGIIWLMPITTRGVERAFGSPYCVKDYRGFHEPFGSEQDFKNLVAAVHAAGMRLILDWVPNHSSWDNALTREHKEFYKQDANGNIQQAYSWSDVAQLDYANAAMRAYMIESLKYWVAKYDIDGYRFDVAWGVPDDFWAQARAELDKGKPLFFLAEANNPKNQAAFDSNYDWELMNVVQDPVLVQIAKGAKPVAALDTLLALDRRTYPAPFMRMRFTSNHDEFGNFGTPFQRLGGAVRPMAVLMSMLPGKPLIYNGQEIGWNPSDRNAPIDWNDTSSFLDFYGRMFRLHQTNPAVHAGIYGKIKSSKDAAVFAFTRTQDADRALVILNLSAQAQEFTLAGDLAAAYTDVFTGQAFELKALQALSLGAWGYRVLVTQGTQVGLADDKRARETGAMASGRGAGNYRTVRAAFTRAGESGEFDAVGIRLP
jgi:1,4-alpha-glucan branching enzyme